MCIRDSVAAVFSVPRPSRSAFRASRCYLCTPFAFFLLLFGVLLFFLCLALFVLLSVLLAVIRARPLPFFLLLSALLFNKHRRPAICSTAPRTARTQPRPAPAKSRPAIWWSRPGATRHSTSIAPSGCDPPPPTASSTQKKTQGARNHPRARVGQAVRDRPGHLQGLLRLSLIHISEPTRPY